jgi:hypothetical protein
MIIVYVFELFRAPRVYKPPDFMNPDFMTPDLMNP